MNRFQCQYEQKLKQLCYKLNIIYLILKGCENMDVIYATLIIRGYKTFAQVPVTLQDRVRQVLIELDMGHLAE